MNSRPLSRRFYRRDVVAVARALLGQRLVRQLDDGTRLAGVIVETEAYLGSPDAAAHTAGGRRTERNASMWGPAGHAYVYFTYGMHHCLNVVAGDVEQPVAALIRAIRPTEGVEAMWRARPAARRVTDLCSGPAKLCQALGVDRSLDGVDLTAGEALWLERGPGPGGRIVATPRVGVDYAGQWAEEELRYLVAESDYVSRRR